MSKISNRILLIVILSLIILITAFGNTFENFGNGTSFSLIAGIIKGVILNIGLLITYEYITYDQEKNSLKHLSTQLFLIITIIPFFYGLYLIWLHFFISEGLFYITFIPFVKWFQIYPIVYSLIITGIIGILNWQRMKDKFQLFRLLVIIPSFLFSFLMGFFVSSFLSIFFISTAG